MDWFRWHNGTVSDPKWRVVARKSGQPIATVVAVWAAICEHANQHELRGTIEGWSERDSEDVAACFDIEPDDVRRIIEGMEGRTLEAGSLTGWHKRNPKREDDSRERVRAFRERKKTPEQGPVTQPNADVTHGNGRVEESRGEKNREEPEVTTALTRVENPPVQTVELDGDDGSGFIHPSQRIAATQVYRAWESQLPNKLAAVDRQRHMRMARKLADGHSAQELALAFLGIGQLFPHCDGEPWDLADLDRKFAKAVSKARDHPELRTRRREAEILAQLEATA